MPRQLCIVSRANPSLFGYLMLALPRSDDLQILVDRRQEGHAQESETAARSERAKAAKDAERRRARGINDSLRDRGWVMLTQDARSGGWVDEAVERLPGEGDDDRRFGRRPTMFAAAGLAMIVVALVIPLGFGIPLPRLLGHALGALSPWPDAPPGRDLSSQPGADAERTPGSSTAARVREEVRMPPQPVEPAQATPQRPSAERPAAPAANASREAARGQDVPRARSEAVDGKPAAEASRPKDAPRGRPGVAEPKATAEAARTKDATRGRPGAVEARPATEAAKAKDAAGARAAAVEPRARPESGKDVPAARAEATVPRPGARIVPFAELPRVELLAEEAGAGNSRTVAYTVKLRDRAGQPVTASEVTLYSAGSGGDAAAAHLAPTSTPGTFQGHASAPFPAREDLRVRVVADGKRFELPVER